MTNLNEGPAVDLFMLSRKAVIAAIENRTPKMYEDANEKRSDDCLWTPYELPSLPTVGMSFPWRGL
jgi:hypothetical protein